MAEYAIQAVFPFVEYWFKEIVRTKDAKLSPQADQIKIKLFQAIRLLGAPPKNLIKPGVSWPLQKAGNPAEAARAEQLNKRCCRAIQSTLSDQQARELMKVKMELQEMSMLLTIDAVAGSDGTGVVSMGDMDSKGNTVDVIQLTKSATPVMTEEELYQHKLSTEFAKDFGRLCSARAPLLFTFLDPNNRIFDEMHETLHEEMLGLAEHLQAILVHGHSPTSNGAHHGHVHRKQFIQNLASELTQESCTRDTKLGILKTLQLTICLTYKRTEKDGYIQWPHGARASVVEEMQTEELAELSQLQQMFCTNVRDASTGINLPAILIHMIGTETQDADLVREAFNLAIVLLTGGNKSMQEAFLEQFQHGRDGVQCFERIQELLAEGRVEAKESQKHYKRERAMALRDENKRRDPIPGAAIARPQVHLIRLFESKVCVRQVLCLLKLFCEGGNRKFQQYLSVQTEAQRSVNLLQASLLYMEKWQRCLHPEIVNIGSYVFATITEFVVGPNRANQESIGDAMKLDAINKILGLEVTNLESQASGPNCAMDTVLKSAAEIQKDMEKDAIHVKSGCVNFLSALIEGAVHADEDRILQKLTQLDTLVMIEYIQHAFKQKAMWEAKENELGLDFGLGLMGDFVPEKLSRTISDGLDKVSEKSGVDVNVVGMLTSPEDEAKLEEFERIEDEDMLAFSFFGLLREIHDDCEPDPKNPKDFVTTTLKIWEDHQTQNARETKKGLLGLGGAIGGGIVGGVGQLGSMGVGMVSNFGGLAKGLGSRVSPMSLGKGVKGAVGNVRGLNAKKLAGAGLGTVKNVGSLGLSVSSKALGSLHQVGKIGIGGLGSLAKGLGELGGIDLSIDDEMDTTIAGALTEYMRQCGRIEIQRADSDGTGRVSKRLQRVYFRIPEYCYMLTDATRENLRWGLSALTPEQKLQKFVEAADDCEGEMKWQNKLDQIKLYQILNKRTYTANGDAKQRLDLWKKITNWLAYFINLLIVIGYEHEDKYWSVPEPWTEWKVEAFGTSFDLGSWTMVDGGLTSAHPHSKKVNYVPTVFYQIISLMGLIQVITCAIVWFVFVLGHGPLVVRKSWKQKYEAEVKARRQAGETIGPTIGLGGFKDHYEKLSAELSPRFVIKSVFYLFHHPLMSYYCGYLLFAVMGIFHSQFWFAFHLLDILQRDQTLQPVIQAVIAPISQIAKTLLLSVIVMYIFTVIAFILFHDNFETGPDTDQNMCNSMLQCLLFTIYSGVIDATMWADMTVHDMWPGRNYRTDFNKHKQTMFIWVFRVFYDMAFFLLIGVLLIGGVLFGILLDKFTELREERRNATERVDTEDFISGLSRDTLDADGNGFIHHKDKDQNMWHYMYFIIYLQNRPVTKFTGSETYVWEQLSAENIGWFPMQRAIVLSHDAGESAARQAQRRTETRLDKVESALAKVTSLSVATLEQLQELKQMMERDEMSSSSDDDIIEED